MKKIVGLLIVAMAAFGQSLAQQQGRERSVVPRPEVFTQTIWQAPAPALASTAFSWSVLYGASNLTLFPGGGISFLGTCGHGSADAAAVQSVEQFDSGVVEYTVTANTLITNTLTPNTLPLALPWLVTIVSADGLHTASLWASFHNGLIPDLIWPAFVNPQTIHAGDKLGMRIGGGEVKYEINQVTVLTQPALVAGPYRVNLYYLWCSPSLMGPISISP